MKPIKDAPLAWRMRPKSRKPYDATHNRLHHAIDLIGALGARQGEPRNALAHAALQTCLNHRDPMARHALVQKLASNSGFSPSECRRSVDFLVRFQLVIQLINDDGVVVVSVNPEAGK